MVLIVALVCLFGSSRGAEQPCDLEALFKMLSDYEYGWDLDAELANDYRIKLSEQHKVCDAEIASLIKETSKQSEESANLSELIHLINKSKAERPDLRRGHTIHYAKGIVDYIKSHGRDAPTNFDEEFGKAVALCRNFIYDYATITNIYKFERDVMKLKMSEVAKDILAKSEICNHRDFDSFAIIEMDQRASAIWSKDHPQH